MTSSYKPQTNKKQNKINKHSVHGNTYVHVYTNYGKQTQYMHGKKQHSNQPITINIFITNYYITSPLKIESKKKKEKKEQKTREDNNIKNIVGKRTNKNHN